MSEICLALPNNLLSAKCLTIVFNIDTQIQDNK